ncbi:MAG: exonuclease SbcCD subunit D [Lachnospiraceae bacterium]|nr:exonuclease SbcCD subunit D [Lachnospiraceae bacterium]
MRILHTSDLHLGLRLKNYDLKEDQEYILKQVAEKAQEQKPDVMIIAGDIYDKAIPSAEAVHLFDGFVTELTERCPQMTILIISGNHDSPERIDCYSSILCRQNLYLAGLVPTEGEFLKKVVLTDSFGVVNFYLLPFVKPFFVRSLMPKEAVTYEDAVRILLEREEIDRSQRNVLVSHQFYVTGNSQVQRSQSEILTVGNVDAVSSELILDFDYAALGHIHTPMRAGAEHLRYCGTPLPYALDEAGQEKGMLLITLGEKGSELQIEKIPLTPLRQARKIEGKLFQVLMQASDDYVSVVLTDEEDLDTLDMQVKLREAFPHLMEIHRSKGIQINYQTAEQLKLEEVNPFQMFCEFYPDITQEEKEILQDIINEVKEEV